MGMLQDQTSWEFVATDESQRSRKSMDERGKWTLEKSTRPTDSNPITIGIRSDFSIVKTGDRYIQFYLKS